SGESDPRSVWIVERPSGVIAVEEGPHSGHDHFPYSIRRGCPGAVMERNRRLGEGHEVDGGQFRILDPQPPVVAELSHPCGELADHPMWPGLLPGVDGGA